MDDIFSRYSSGIDQANLYGEGLEFFLRLVELKQNTCHHESESFEKDFSDGKRVFPKDITRNGMLEFGAEAKAENLDSFRQNLRKEFDDLRRGRKMACDILTRRYFTPFAEIRTEIVAFSDIYSVRFARWCPSSGIQTNGGRTIFVFSPEERNEKTYFGGHTVGPNDRSQIHMIMADENLCNYSNPFGVALSWRLDTWCPSIQNVVKKMSSYL